MSKKSKSSKKNTSTILDNEINLVELQKSMQFALDDSAYYYKLGFIVQELQGKLPMLNIEYPFFKGTMPRGYINPRAVIVKGIHPIDTYLVDAPDNLILPLDYSVKYPMDIIATQAPFWEMLKGEKLEFYHAFRLYVQMKYTNEKYTRSLSGVAKQLDVNVQLISSISKLYQWKFRAKGYDMWYNKQQYNQQQHTIIQVTNANAKTAKKLLDKVTEALNIKLANTSPDKEQLSDMSISALVKLMQELMEIERLNIGLQKNAPHAIEGVNTDNTINGQKAFEGQLSTPSLSSTLNDALLLTRTNGGTGADGTPIDPSKEALEIAEILKAVQGGNDEEEEEEEEK